MTRSRCTWKYEGNCVSCQYNTGAGRSRVNSRSGSGFVTAGHIVQAIYGALQNPAPPRVILDATRLQSDEEVVVFFDLTSSKPIRLQIVLHRDPNQVPVMPDSPPPDDGPYLVLDFLNAAELYDNPAEASDTIQRNLAAFANRAFPKRDYALEERKMKIRKRMR